MERFFWNILVGRLYNTFEMLLIVSDILKVQKTFINNIIHAD